MASKRRQLVTKIKQLIKLDKQNLASINKQLAKTEISINNTKLFKLLSKAYKLEVRLKFWDAQLNQLQYHRNPKRLMISMRSKVKLVSTKIGAIVWVDAKNYLELVGKQVGDIVTMQNNSFMVAGVY